MLEFAIDKRRTSWDDDVADEQEQPEDLGIERKSFNFIPLEKLCDSEDKTKKQKKNSAHNIFSIDNAYLITNYTQEETSINDKSYIDKVLEKSVLNSGLEKEKAVSVKKNKRALQRERKMEREKTKGKNWFNLPATELTDEIKNDMKILKMRSVLDSKQFYKKNDFETIPKYFQVGKVVEGAADFYNGRIKKSQRKNTLVDELLQDSNFRAYQRKKYKEIVDESRRKKPNKNVVEKRKIKKNLKDDWLKWD